jgi:hypothetical protein
LLFTYNCPPYFSLYVKKGRSCSLDLAPPSPLPLSCFPLHFLLALASASLSLGSEDKKEQREGGKEEGGKKYEVEEEEEGKKIKTL